MKWFALIFMISNPVVSLGPFDTEKDCRAKMTGQMKERPIAEYQDGKHKPPVFGVCLKGNIIAMERE